MRRETAQRLEDIIETAEVIQRRLPADRAGLDDEVQQAALRTWVQIIGEAASRVDADVRAANPEVPWRNIIGMRHRIVHSYYEVDLDILWDVATLEVPRLVPQIKAILASLPDEEL